MSRTQKYLTKSTGLLAACAAAFISASSSAAVMQDNFDNNAIASFWTAANQGTTKVTETTGRLCFRSTSDIAGPRRAYYASNGWTYRGHENAVITFSYKLDVAGLTGNESAAIGVYTIEPSEASALEIQVIQKASGRFIEYRLWVDEDDGNGLQQIGVVSKPLSNATGDVEIRYNKTSDKLTVKVDGVNKITVQPLNGDYPPFDLDVELFGKANRTAFANSKAWIDDFRIQGVID